MKNQPVQAAEIKALEVLGGLVALVVAIALAIALGA
jgi:hypothetical protein